MSCTKEESESPDDTLLTRGDAGEDDTGVTGDTDDDDDNDDNDDNDDDDNDTVTDDDDTEAPPDASECIDWGTCVGDYDCPQQYVCTDGVCVSNHCICTGCDESATCNEYSGVCNENPDCYRDLDCDEGEKCVGGKCEEPAGCQGNYDCPPGYICQNSECVLAYECYADSDCATGETCVDGYCEGVAPECTSDWDCATNEICQNGSCVQQSAECTTAADCAYGQQCIYGKCTSTTTGGCNSDADCAGDYFGDIYCDPATHECEECVIDDHCQPGWACDSSFNICMPDASRCGSDYDCEAGTICNLTTGVCEMGCTSDADCAPAETCDKISGHCGPGVGCVSDADCDAGMVCDETEKVCKWPLQDCEFDAECPSDQYCDTEEGKCKEKPKCQSDAECGEGRICPVSGQCTAIGNCNYDVDCHAGEQCHAPSGKCGIACSWSGDCDESAGYECDPYISFCVKPTTDAWCYDEWDENAPGSEGDKCEQDFIDCQSALKCIEGITGGGLRCYQNCWDDSDCCTSGLKCKPAPDDPYTDICIP